jgi:acyl-coenzyme A thioesterase PaaI-like protein
MAWTDSALFRTAMALRPVVDDGTRAVYEGELSTHWTIGPKVHGGVMVALCANAARTAHAGAVQPICVATNFLGAPNPGPVRLATTVRKRGRRVSLVDVELIQGDRAAVHASVTLGEPEHHVPPLLSTAVLDVMPAEPPPDVEPVGPGHPLYGVVNFAAGCDIRPALSTLRPLTEGGRPLIQVWIRPRHEVPDALFALMCGDASSPVTMTVNRRGWAPTVQLTAYLRGLPADGWLRVMCTTTQIGQDWFDEDHLVVDSEGRIVVQTRQLAMVPGH